MINFDEDLQSLTDGPVISIDNIDNNNDSDTFDPALQASDHREHGEQP